VHGQDRHRVLGGVAGGRLRLADRQVAPLLDQVDEPRQGEEPLRVEVASQGADLPQVPEALPSVALQEDALPEARALESPIHETRQRGPAARRAEIRHQLPERREPVRRLARELLGAGQLAERPPSVEEPQQSLVVQPHDRRTKHRRERDLVVAGTRHDPQQVGEVDDLPGLPEPAAADDAVRHVPLEERALDDLHVARRAEQHGHVAPPDRPLPVAPGASDRAVLEQRHQPIRDEVRLAPARGIGALALGEEELDAGALGRDELSASLEGVQDDAPPRRPDRREHPAHDLEHLRPRPGTSPRGTIRPSSPTRRASSRMTSASACRKP
jgi:hypothetical protein